MISEYFDIKMLEHFQKAAAILKDRFGNSSIVADIKNIRLKEIGSGKTELPKV